jgi:hypothetical protein
MATRFVTPVGGVKVVLPVKVSVITNEEFTALLVASRHNLTVAFAEPVTVAEQVSVTLMST